MSRQYSTATASATWESVKTLLATAATASGAPVERWLWQSFVISNTHATATLLFQEQPTQVTAPADTTGFLLNPGEALGLDAAHGYINGNNLWVRTSAAGSFCISIVSKGK